MNICNLRIGDEVTYMVPLEFFCDTTMLDGTVTGIFNNHVEINHSFLIYCDKIVSKKTKEAIKSEPRTFKFEIIITSGKSKNTRTREPLGSMWRVDWPNDGEINTVNGYTVKGNTQVDFTGLLAPDWMILGKSYTVEIKENSEKV